MLMTEIDTKYKSRDCLEAVIHKIRKILQDCELSTVAIMGISDLFNESIFNGRPLTDALKSKKGRGGDLCLPFNTYPYGEPTSDIYPVMIAVCDKKSNFKRDLDAVATHGLAYGGNRVKEIVLLTSTWDTKEFRDNFEDKFLLAADNGVNIVIILVTDYGAHEIAHYS